ncbi:response regulator [Streptomyces sp. SID5998]|nr:response regulator [Streptomyces sp. SID5998]
MDVHVTGTPRPLPPAVEVVAPRAAQEALADVRESLVHRPHRAGDPVHRVRMLDGRSDLEVVSTASSGPEGVALCARLPPDIVPMDLRMPGGDGVDATRRTAAAHADATRVASASSASPTARPRSPVR